MSNLTQAIIFCLLDDRNHERNKELRNLLSVCDIGTEEEAARAMTLLLVTSKVSMLLQTLKLVTT